MSVLQRGAVSRVGRCCDRVSVLLYTERGKGESLHSPYTVLGDFNLLLFPILFSYLFNIVYYQYNNFFPLVLSMIKEEKKF